MRQRSDPAEGRADDPAAFHERDDEPYALMDGRSADVDLPGDVALSRRMLLRRGGFAAAALVMGSGAQLLWPAGRAEAHGTIRSYPGVWGQKTAYEDTGALTSFGYRPSFHGRMADWLEFWYRNTPSNFLKPMRIWTLGVHNDRGSAAHDNGRGFDLTRIYATGNDDERHRRFFARYDIWKDWPTDRRRAVRRHYWATAASLHHHFRHVLTYPYDSNHHSHIHIDNLISGGGNSTFDTGSEAQVLNVQACCRYLWGKSTTIDGVWGPQTRNHSTDVLRRIGRENGTIASSQGNWLAFNRATCRKGYGVESY